MQVEDCYQLGYVLKTHGLSGEVVITLDVDFPHEYENMESVFLLKEDLIPFFLSSMQINRNKAFVQFEDVETLDEAKALVGSKLYLPESELPKLEDKNQYYYHELVNCKVFENGQLLGKISGVYQPSSQFIASVMVSGRELLLPIADEIFLQVNTNSKIVEVNIPEGLKEIYL